MKKATCSDIPAGHIIAPEYSEGDSEATVYRTPGHVYIEQAVLNKSSIRSLIDGGEIGEIKLPVTQHTLRNKNRSKN